MKKRRLISRTTRVADLDDLIDDIADDWQLRAEQLQARRWRKLKMREMI